MKIGIARRSKLSVGLLALSSAWSCAPTLSDTDEAHLAVNTGDPKDPQVPLQCFPGPDSLLDPPPSKLLSIRVESVDRLQPGWVRLHVSHPAARASITARVGCAAPTVPDSVTAMSAPRSDTESVVELRTNLDFMEHATLPPCRVQGIDLTMSVAGRPVAATHVAANIAMDLPLSHLRPSLLAPPVEDTEVYLDPVHDSFRAYPPRLVAVRTTRGGTSFIEVEELEARRTLGLRGLATFASGDYVNFELAGGAEVFPGWGIDADELGVTKATSGTEERNLGRNTFNFDGPGLSPITEPTLCPVFPAPPLFTETSYYESQIDNRGVPRCREGGSCLDVVYDAKSHLLRASGSATVLDLDPGPPCLGPQTEIPVPDWGVLDGPNAHVESPMAVLQSSAAIPAPVEQVNVDIEGSPQVQAIESLKGHVAPAEPLPGSCALDPATARALVNLPACAGMHGTTFLCPRAEDPIRVEDLPDAPGDGHSVGIIRSLPPYLAGQRNVFGTCANHAWVSAYEAVINRYVDDLAPPRTIDVRGEPIRVPTPRMTYSVAAGLWQVKTGNGIVSGDPDIHDGEPPPNMEVPNLVEGYWPARESRWWAWQMQPLVDDYARQALTRCTEGTGFFRSAYCMGQGSPPPGAYYNYTRIKDARIRGLDPLSDLPWTLANTYFKSIQHDLSLADRVVAISETMRELERGFPLVVWFPSEAGRLVTDPIGASYGFRAGEGTTWYVPAPIAGCPQDVFNATLRPTAGHAVVIMGYVLDGDVHDFDPVNSYFVLLNNWGNTRGYHGYSFMNFVAFRLLTYKLFGLRIDQTCASEACAHHP